MKEQVNILFSPDLKEASMIVCWKEDPGKLGSLVSRVLIDHLKARIFGEVNPEHFFTLGGVIVEDNVAQFPISRFYAGESRDIVVFESNQPQIERYHFLSCLLDTGEYYCQVKEIYALGGIITPIAHTSPRRLMVVYNQPELRDKLRQFELAEVNWEGPPAVNSYLSWLAQRRNMPAISIWAEVAFYLASSSDWTAVKSVLSFLDHRFVLGLDFSGIDRQLKLHNEQLARLREQNPEVDRYIRTLEVGLSLTEEEQLSLTSSVSDFLG